MEQYDRFLRLDEVIKKTGLKKSTIYFLASKKEFPQSINITSRSVAWLESEINQWMKEQIQNRN